MNGSCCTPGSTLSRPTFAFSPVSRSMDEFVRSVFEPAGHSVRSASPALRAWATDASIAVELDVPGYKLNEIDITFVNRELTVQGKRAVELPEGAALIHDERGSSEFSRTLRLSTPVDAERVSAELKDGVLKITLPKAEAARSRKIAISTTNN